MLQRLQFVALSLLFLVFLLLTIRLLVYSTVLDTIFVSADVSLIESIYRDLIGAENGLRGWLFSKATFAFPDIFLYISIRHLTGDYLYAMQVYSVIYSLILIAFVLTFIKSDNDHSSSIFILAFSIYSFVIYLFSGQNTNIGMPLALIYPLWHAGPVIAGYATLYITHRQINYHDSPNSYMVLSLLSFLSVFSDLWWVLWYAAPMFALMAFLMLFSKVRFIQFFKYSLALAVPGLLGGNFHKALATAGYYFPNAQLGTPSSRLVDQISVMVSDFGALFIESPLLFIVVVSATFVSVRLLLSSFSAVLSKQFDAEKFDYQLMVSFLFLASLAIVVFCILFFKLWGGNNFRYFTGPINSAWLLMTLTVFGLAQRFKNTVSICMVGTIALSAFMMDVASSVGRVLSQPIRATPYTTTTACIDKVAEAYRLKTGISEYEDARQNALFSRNDLTINQVTYLFEPLHWVNNIFSYFDTDSGNGLVEYDFVLAYPHRESFRRVIHYFGEPSLRFDCGAHIFVYKGSNGNEFNAVLASIFLSWFEKNGFTVPGNLSRGHVGKGPPLDSELIKLPVPVPVATLGAELTKALSDSDQLNDTTQYLQDFKVLIRYQYDNPAEPEINRRLARVYRHFTDSTNEPIAREAFIAWATYYAYQTLNTEQPKQEDVAIFEKYVLELKAYQPECNTRSKIEKDWSKIVCQ
jgi:hypothetical protein